MRTPIIAGNWKLFKKSGEAVELVSQLTHLVRDTKGVEIIIAPVFTVLSTVKPLIANSNIKLAAQNCFWEEEGAFTGEISPGMLMDAGCTHVIIGHSERRQYFGETDDKVNRKIKAAISSGLTVLFCIGETLAEREANCTFNVLRTQIEQGLSELAKSDLAKAVIAYEPVWAIGTGKTATDDQAQEAHAFIRGVVADLYDHTSAESIRILYGGSVKPENVKELMAQPDIDGALVGGASLKADSFAAIVNYLV
ncbi:triose-phosphate isomerase [Geobacter benzoatilyticus]|uniref:Triosephosphate isomerase n=1 Tax=Geobacter benzoatilyticus TaxID=2815309 RepID=A0ABX7Q1A0_9BACT|nr:triose-phosphate isomerase [Geobacter benzoatilyticus]QSV45172.1 triose-phosphate isomerase [Geobacter benzoatilyticus]